MHNTDELQLTCKHTCILHLQAEEAAAAVALEDTHNSAGDSQTMHYTGSTDSIGTATAAYDVDALLSDAKGERLGVDPKRLAQFVRLLQGGRAIAGANGFHNDVDGDLEDPQGAGMYVDTAYALHTIYIVEAYGSK